MKSEECMKKNEWNTVQAFKMLHGWEWHGVGGIAAAAQNLSTPKIKQMQRRGRSNK